MFKDFFRKSEVEIIKIKKIDNAQPFWGGDGIVFYVKNGKNILGNKYGSIEDKGLSALFYEDIPLIKFHGDEYFCPTCEKLVSAGYGLNTKDGNTIEKLRETLNAEFISLEQSLDDLKPLLGLLTTGYYALIDVELQASDGNGEFFWKVSNHPVLNKASCSTYGGDGLWSDPRPYYILPTQPPSLFNREQVEFYRKNNNYRAVAYFLEGYLCALLDGHHKATASAIEKRPVKSLVIVPGWAMWDKDVNGKIKACLSLNGVVLQQDELPIDVKESIDIQKKNRLSEDEVQKYLRLTNKDFENIKWDEDILSIENSVLDVLTLARIEWAGDLSEERINNILDGKELLQDDQIRNIILALCEMDYSNFKKVAFYFCRIEVYSRVWYQTFILLAKIKDPDVDDFFVQFLVEKGFERPELKKIIDAYFRGEV